MIDLANTNILSISKLSEKICTSHSLTLVSLESGPIKQTKFDHPRLKIPTAHFYLIRFVYVDISTL